MSATSPPIATPPTGPAAQDERLVPISRITRTLRRPELGSLLAAVFVFVMFAITDSSSNHLWLKQTGLAAWTQQAAFFGIVAVPVGLLMIGGEFDLSAGVMTGVTAIVMALLVGKWHVDTWIAILITLAFADRDRADQRLHRRADQAAELHRHAGHVLRAARREHRRRAAAQQRQHADHGHHAASRRAEQREVDLRQLVLLERLASERLLDGDPVVHRGDDRRRPGCSAGRRSATGSSPSAGTRTPPATSACRSTARRSCCSSATALAAALVGIISFTAASSAVSEQGVGYEFFYIIAAVVGGCLLTGGYGSAIGAALGACIIGMAFEG